MILLISTCKDKLSELEFVKPIERIAGTCVVKHCRDVNLKDISSSDKIIITGTALADFDYLESDFSWLQLYDNPVLGICAGMQIIAKAFNIALEKKTTIGVRPVEVVKENKIAKGTFNAYFLHTLTGKGNFEAIAMSEGVPCMIKHPQKEIYATIFHPEVMNEDMIKKFLS